MSYKNLKNISEVCETFNLKYKEEEFIKTKNITADESFKLYKNLHFGVDFEVNKQRELLLINNV